MKRSLFILLCFVFAYSHAQEVDLTDDGKQYWTKKEWRKSNTAYLHFYMPKRIRESIRFQNLARQYPLKFSSIYVESQDPSNKNKVLINALHNHIADQHKLKPNFNLFVSSYLHSIYSGISGHTGHRFFNARIAIVKPLSTRFTGENCSYGSRDGLSISMGLLKSPGHRKNILNEDFYRVGGASFIHFSEYKTNSVFMYANPTWKDFITRLKPHKQDLGINIGVSQISTKPILDFGIAYHATQNDVREYMLKLNFHKGIENYKTDGVSLCVSSGQKSLTSGLKSSIFFENDEMSYYITPEVSLSTNLLLFFNKRGRGYSINGNHTSIYSLTYGYNFNLFNSDNPNIFPHTISISRYINLITKKN